MIPLYILLCVLIGSNVADIHRGGILYPRASRSRQVTTLDGLWDFIAANNSNPFLGFQQHWYKTNLRKVNNSEVLLMPVPASYNDITTNPLLRDHVGLVWYHKSFFAPKSWSGEGRVWLRFGSVSYAAQVWINGEFLMSHEIGHLPFVGEVTKLLKYGEENFITVACDNTLLADTIPQGKLEEIKSGRLTQTYTFDFFNYAGIDRPVHLYTTPNTYIDDISVRAELVEDVAFLNYNVTVLGDDDVNDVICRVTLIDKDQNIAAIDNNTETGTIHGLLRIENPRLWWPYLMHDHPGYLYTLKIDLLSSQGDTIDTYSLPVGLREIQWTETSLLINSKPIYLHGFGKHEDSDIRGKGFDLPLIIKDYELIKWVGANVYRTSHYPYAEEIMDLADEMGIMIIDECPAVNIELFSDNLLAKHKTSLFELIRRDKNRPGVIIWSAANEPRTQYIAAKEYFREVIETLKEYDTSRPCTIVEAQSVNLVESSRFVDIISFNRYNGWYSYPGELDVVKQYVVEEARNWHKKFNKPVIMQEYGADTLEGLHFAPSFIWSEEYQVELMSEHFKAFDQLRKEDFFIGEFIWNFADFKTAQTYTRVGGNKKGIFTRNRQPKASAHHLRRRYWSLAGDYANVTLPTDLDNYVITSSQVSRDEL